MTLSEERKNSPSSFYKDDPLRDFYRKKPVTIYFYQKVKDNNNRHFHKKETIIRTFDFINCLRILMLQ